MREIEVTRSAYPVCLWNGVDEVSSFSCEDECRFLFLEAKALPARIEDFFVMFARYQGGLRVAPNDCLGSRVVEDVSFVINNLNHKSILYCSRAE